MWPNAALNVSDFLNRLRVNTQLIIMSLESAMFKKAHLACNYTEGSENQTNMDASRQTCIVL